MIKVTLTNEILKWISEIDENRFSIGTIELPNVTKNRLRKNSKKKSSYASNKIEGNPLTEQQANEAIDSDPHRHFLRPEQEVRNYFLALNFLEEKLKKKEHLSKDMILKVQAIVEKGASKEKIGLRGPMPPGVLFAVYDSETGVPEYQRKGIGSALIQEGHRIAAELGYSYSVVLRSEMYYPKFGYVPAQNWFQGGNFHVQINSKKEK